MRTNSAQRRPVVLAPGEGRGYDMGRIRAVFKADGARGGRWLLDLGVVAGAQHDRPRRSHSPRGRRLPRRRGHDVVPGRRSLDRRAQRIVRLGRSGRTERARITSPASQVDGVRIGDFMSVGHAVVGAQIDRSAVTSARGPRSAGVATHAAVVVATVFILADDLDGPGVDGSVAASAFTVDVAGDGHAGVVGRVAPPWRLGRRLWQWRGCRRRRRWRWRRRRRWRRWRWCRSGSRRRRWSGCGRWCGRCGRRFGGYGRFRR